MEIDYALVDEDGKALTQRRRRWPRLVKWTLLVLLGIVLIFHRPIIFGLGRSVANHYAAKANLRIDCSLGGTIFTGLVVRNLRVVPIGPTIVESIDSKVCLRRVVICHGTPNAKNNRPVKYQDDCE